ncbi:MAG: hypothetical protein ABI605_23775, partial [Rhizobacter sp.]
NLIVALIVAACAGYAVWVLMPSALRRVTAQGMLSWPWPQAVSTRLRRAAMKPTGCACDGCDAGPKKAAGSTQTIRIHRQPKR